jgi:hypothetical protein
MYIYHLRKISPVGGSVSFGLYPRLTELMAMAFFAATLSTKARRIIARYSRPIITLTLINATLATISFVYLKPLEIDNSLRSSWDYGMTQQGSWGNLLSEWRHSALRSVPVQGLFGGEELPQHVWDTVCHEAVEKGLKVAVYDFTPFHDGK